MPVFQTINITQVEEVNDLLISYVVDGFGKKLYQVAAGHDILTIRQIDQSTGRARNTAIASFLWSSGRAVVAFGESDQQKPVEQFLYDNDPQLGDKILALGTLQYHWRRLDENYYDNRRVYQINDRLDTGHPHVRLTVTLRPNSANTASMEISEHISVHSLMFDHVVAAVLWMFRNRDPWVM